MGHGSVSFAIQHICGNKNVDRARSEEAYSNAGFNYLFSPQVALQHPQYPFNGAMPDAIEHDEPQSDIEFSYSMFDMPEAPQVAVEEKDRGANALVHTFYEGPPKCKCCTNWVEKPPPPIPEATLDRYEQAAIRIYKKKGWAKTYGGILGQKIVEIEIQSPVIIKPSSRCWPRSVCQSIRSGRVF